MIFSRKDNDIIMAKKHMQKAYFLYDIIAPITEEQKIISKLLKYTNDFLIILDKYFETRIPIYKSFNCNSNNVVDCLEKIFNGTGEYTANYIRKNTSDNIHIIFVKIQDEEKNGYIELFQNNYKFHLLIMAAEKYKLFDFYSMNNKIVVRVKKKIEENHKFIFKNYRDINQYDTTNILLHTNFSGIGDYFRFSSLWIEFAFDLLSVNLHPILALVENIPSNEIAENLLEEYSFVYFSSSIQKKYCLDSLMCKNVINLEYKFNEYLDQCNSKPYKTNHEILNELLEIDKVNPYKYDYILQKRILDSIDIKEKKYIDSVFNNKNFIGLQYFSGASLNNEKNKWVSAIYKDWSSNNVECFMKIANKKNIDIILLNENPYDLNINYSNVIQLKPVSVFAYAYAISKLEVLIGIESSAGHIAGFYNRPNITLWGGTTTPFCFFGNLYSYRVLRKNLSVVSKSNDVNLISPNKVIELLDKVIVIDDHIIDYHETNNVYYV